jgi:aspartyl-tRNA(Asn)/glutamyl-tRNA(Gln) amidotransferase subunit B
MHHTTIIGLEVHVQLLTKTKLFCGCPNKFNPDQPNVQTCPVCLGLPGSLPVMNREAFQLALRAALALNCDISLFTKWDRKQYYYPDLPKGYQISQFDLPFSHDGFLAILAEEEAAESRKIGIIRVHLEEDAGKNLHDESGGKRDSRVDLNRAGTPLLEIVSEPDLRSAAEAKKYLEELKLLLSYLQVSDCNMQEGSLRCDANVNLHIHADSGELVETPIVEIKNLNSFRGVEAAIEYEVHRQLGEWQKSGAKRGDVPKETRGWDAERGLTFSQRGKEEVSDYRYFPDPDLVPATVSEEQLDLLRDMQPELPAGRRDRFQIAFMLPEYDAAVIIDQGERFADYFEQTALACGDGKQAANWMLQDVLRELNERKLDINQFPLRPSVLSALLHEVIAGKITTKSAREIYSDLLAESDRGREPTDARVAGLIQEKGLAIVRDTGELERVIAAVIGKNSKAVADYHAGKQAAAGVLIGQVMREMKGADPAQVRQMLVERLEAERPPG